jgi:GNAT superfamily N-acetyltransferase
LTGRPPDIAIGPLTPNSPWRTQIADEQFDYWGPLTGHNSRSSYEAFLEQAAHSRALPRVLLAASDTALHGSVNLMMTEMAIRPQFAPWMGQLFVAESQRARGTGTRLLDAAISYVGDLGYQQLFLFTSGALPDYYRKRGWTDVEDVTYLGGVRTILRVDIKRQVAF